MLDSILILNYEVLMMKNSVTMEDILSEIQDTTYYVFPNTTVTVCLLTLKNGYHVLGHSACVDPANFNKELGEKIAYDNAVDKCWELLGFRLRDELSK